MSKKELLKDLFNDQRQERLQDPNQQLIELEMKKRLIRAKELSRITPDKTPDFLGNFDHDLPRGIFEMFIQEKDGNYISGVIEDCYGTAIFKGTISDTEVSFIKHYIPDQSSVNASESDIKYEGDFLGCEYYGSYSYISSPKYGGMFSLKRDFINQI